MAGKQIRIDPNLHSQLQLEANRYSLTVGQYISRLVKELNIYHKFMRDHGLDLTQDDGRIVRLSSDTWAQLNTFRANYILRQPVCIGSIDEVIVFLLERHDHDEQQNRHVDTGPL